MIKHDEMRVKRQLNDRRRQPVSRRAIVAATAALCATHGVISTTAARDMEPIQQPKIPGHGAFMERAFQMRQQAIDLGDQAYGAVVVKDKKIIGQSWSRVILDQDPTGHAEMAAIRDAARRIGSRSLDSAVMYSSSRPCPMCEAGAYWAGIDKLIHGKLMNDAGSPVLCR